MNLNYIKMAGMLLAFLGIFISGTGCATTVQRGPISRDAPLTTGLDMDDLREIVDEMVDSMLAAPRVQRSVDTFISQHPQGLPPVLVQNPVQNKTRSRVDLTVVNNKVRATLINSGLFQVLDRRADSALRDEMIYQQESGMSDARGAPQLGRQMNAAYQLITELLEVRVESGRIRDVTYSVKMELLHLETGFTLWINEMEIGKSQKRGLLSL
jgi:uncharacterized protein (TIGR02722 family)